MRPHHSQRGAPQHVAHPPAAHLQQAAYPSQVRLHTFIRHRRLLNMCLRWRLYKCLLKRRARVLILECCVWFLSLAGKTAYIHLAGSILFTFVLKQGVGQKALWTLTVPLVN